MEATASYLLMLEKYISSINILVTIDICKKKINWSCQILF